MNLDVASSFLPQVPEDSVCHFTMAACFLFHPDHVISTLSVLFFLNFAPPIDFVFVYCICPFKIPV